MTLQWSLIPKWRSMLLHHIVKWRELILLKTIFIPGHGVSIILIVCTNMPCINFLSPTNNLSLDGKSRVFSCARLKSLLLHLMWKVVWHLCGRRIVIPFILFINGTWNIWRRLTITHCIRSINVGFIWWITELSLYTHWLKISLQWVLSVWDHPSLPTSIWLSNSSQHLNQFF